MLTSEINKEKDDLLFRIISAHINEGDESERKHVIYTLQVRHIARKDELTLATIDRRYTQFLKLYTELSAECPNLMLNVAFPRKTIMGNFDNALITARSSAFESLLDYIVSNATLLSSQPLINFLQDTELSQAKQHMSSKNYAAALPLLENNFTLLNNVYTDRSPPVLLALCRLLGCCCMVGASQAQKWADLALHRFEAVCDTELLVLYVPLLYKCKEVLQKYGQDVSVIEGRLADFKRKGINCNENSNLLEAVSKVELNVAGTL